MTIVSLAGQYASVSAAFTAAACRCSRLLPTLTLHYLALLLRHTAPHPPPQPPSRSAAAAAALPRYKIRSHHAGGRRFSELSNVSECGSYLYVGANVKSGFVELGEGAAGALRRD